LGTVESIAQDGTMRLKLDNERSMNFDPQRHPHLDHSYAGIGYSSQGQTANRVLINVDTELVAKDLLNTAWRMCQFHEVVGRADIHERSRKAVTGFGP
jgi:ATP-dependent exoDNAse (exonuclease V) alpha subunit